MPSVKNLAVFLLGCFAALVVLELFLRIFDPFQFRVKGDTIILPSNRTYKIHLKGVKGMEKEVIHSKNSLGFRGKELPSISEKYLTLIAVGGSTTECYFLADGKDWPSVTGTILENKFTPVWINNAGFEGHSTFGHQILMNDYIRKIKPDVVLFLIGCNDIGRDDLDIYDREQLSNSYSSWGNFIVKNCEIASVIVNLIRAYRAIETNRAHMVPDLIHYKTLVIPDPVIDSVLDFHRVNYLKEYAQRITGLAESCKTYGIIPVFITQPSLAGAGRDSITGADLEMIQTGTNENGKLYWKIIDLYNHTTAAAAAVNGCLVIDLGKKMPKNSLYFYDFLHYTEQGSGKAAEIVAGELEPYLAEKFPQYRKH